MSAKQIQIRKGLFFWQGQYVKAEGIPSMGKTYRAFTRQGILFKMGKVRVKEINREARLEWEVVG